MRIDVLRMLSGDYVSGEDISKALGISRAAVWKNINALKEDGGVVEAKTNAGYRLVKLPDILKPEYICCYMEKPEGEIVWLESVDSTNTYAKQIARNGATGGTVVVAEHQTGGKGRLGRSWASNAREAVQMSFVVRPEGLPPSKAPMFNFAVALGVSNAVKRELGVDTQIKWPNDVVFRGKKLCGILTEMSADMDHIEYIVSGVGVNVNQQAFAPELADRAVSLRMIKGEKVDRVRLCAVLTEEIQKEFDSFLAGEVSAMMDEYREKSAVLGKEVRVSGANETVEGICTGFGGDGEIIVEHGDERRRFHAGEVSVRGVQDYV